MDASQVQYVARAGNYVRHGFSYHGALRILKVIMGYDYLWINVRVKGGAYGCMNSYMRNGDTYFVSYRDPNLKKTDGSMTVSRSILPILRRTSVR